MLEKLQEATQALEQRIADAFASFRAEMPEQAIEESTIEIESDIIPLSEAAVGADGTARIKIADAGWGSSGYYSKDMLKRDGPQVFKRGLHMYMNHPTVTESTERPERSVEDLAAVLNEDAMWDDSGPHGAGLYANAEIFPSYRQPLKEKSQHIGVSLRARGRAAAGEAEGRKGRIIKEMMNAQSVDFVTLPGRGGSIVEMMESARTSQQINERQPAAIVSEESQDMDMEKLQETLAPLQEQLAALAETNATLQAGRTEDQGRIAQLNERLMLSDASRIVGNKLASSDIAEPTRKRLAESLVKNPPTSDDGTLDVDALHTRIEESVTAEQEYLASLGSTGQIVGMGESRSTESKMATVEESQKAMMNAFLSLGMTEAEAQIAAGGR